MRIKFIGAAGGSVTGSCTHFFYPRTNVSFLVDCGVVQGGGDIETINTRPFPFDASEIDFVLLTHAHQDHCGLLPKLCREGFTGEVICTAATAKLAKLSLLDAAGYPTSRFTRDDVNGIRFKPIEDQPGMAKAAIFPVRKDIFVSFRRTAHIVGSCSVTIGWLDEQDRHRYIVMSGDLGNNVRENLYQPLLGHRRSIFGYPDAIVVESTYGNRLRSPDHKSFEARIDALRQLLQREVFDRKALLVVPAFALQRTHEVLLDLVVVLQRHFASEATATAPYLASSRYFQHFVEGSWTRFAHAAVVRAIDDLPSDEQILWRDAFEFKEEEERPWRLAHGHAKSMEEVRSLVEERRTPYAVDIILDSKLARKMGVVIREELLRRSAHDHTELAHRNPELMARLGLATEEELEKLLSVLLPDSSDSVASVSIGPHTVRYAESLTTPSRASCAVRGAILLTGGGMCEGGPVVAHLEKLTDQERECVLVQTGFMSQASLGGRLAQIARDKEQGITTPGSFITVGSRTNIPVSDIYIRTADLSPYYSGHADQGGLVDFVCVTDGRVPHDSSPTAATVFINHGNPDSRSGLKAAIEARSKAGCDGDREIAAVELPEAGMQVYDLVLGQWVTEEKPQGIEHLLSALLREQVKTNELLRQLIHAKAQQAPRFVPKQSNK